MIAPILFVGMTAGMASGLEADRSHYWNAALLVVLSFVLIAIGLYS